MIRAALIAAILLAAPVEPGAPAIPRVQWVVLHAAWCKPCVDAQHQYRPYFERLRPKPLMVSPVPHADVRLVDIDLDRDEANELLSEWGDKQEVQSVPQFVLLVDGKPVERHWRYPGVKRLHEAHTEAVKSLGAKK